MTYTLRATKLFLLAAAIVLAASLCVGTASAAEAKKKTPCWKTLINDWYDGRIDGVYPVHCYREALQHLPADVDAYSSARDDIRQALQRRIQSAAVDNQSSGGSGGGAGPTSGGGGSSGSGGGSTANGGGSGSGGGNSAAPGGPVDNIIDAGKPAKADSLPIPLLVLGGLAIVLMAAGAVGFVVRRQRTRRELAASAATFPPRASEQP